MAQSPVFADTETWAYIGNGTRLDGWRRAGNQGISTVSNVAAGIQVQL